MRASDAAATNVQSLKFGLSAFFQAQNSEFSSVWTVATMSSCLPAALKARIAPTKASP